MEFQSVTSLKENISLCHKCLYCFVNTNGLLDGTKEGNDTYVGKLRRNTRILHLKAETSYLRLSAFSQISLFWMFRCACILDQLSLIWQYSKLNYIMVVLCLIKYRPFLSTNHCNSVKTMHFYFLFLSFGLYVNMLTSLWIKMSVKWRTVNVII